MSVYTWGWGVRASGVPPLDGFAGFLHISRKSFGISIS